MNLKKTFLSKKDAPAAIILSVLFLTFAGLSLYYLWKQQSLDHLFTELSRPVAVEQRRLLNQRVYRQIDVRKIRIDGDRQYLWAAGPMSSEYPQSRWFDMTGSPLPLKYFQFGIGRDSIPSIDSPVFVKPDDPRLKKYWALWGVQNIDDLEVIGFAYNGDARAYPRLLLNNRELVNDTVGGKPVTVGW